MINDRDDKAQLIIPILEQSDTLKKAGEASANLGRSKRIVYLIFGIAFLLTQLLLIGMFSADDPMTYIIIYAALLIIEGFGFLIAIWINQNSYKGSVKSTFDNMDWNPIYKKAYEMLRTNKDLEFDSIIVGDAEKRSGNQNMKFLRQRMDEYFDPEEYNENSMSFKYKGKPVYFFVSNTYDEYYVQVNKDYQQKHELYYQKVIVENDKYNDYNGIVISKNRINTKKAHTESIDFNKKYSVKYDDELKMFKLLKPKVIDAFSSAFERLPKSWNRDFFVGDQLQSIELLDTIGNVDSEIINRFKVYNSTGAFKWGMAREIVDEFERFNNLFESILPIIK